MKRRERLLDQYYTTPFVANYCVNTLRKLNIDINAFNVVLEPSYGKGAFLRALTENGLKHHKLVYIDIDSNCTAHRKDFLTCDVPKRCHGCLTIGNPPFGIRGSMAIKFFNQASQFSNVIAFILPPMFLEKAMKTKFNSQFELIFEELVPNSYFIYQNNLKLKQTIFQVWRRIK